MTSLFDIDPKSSVPLYVQLKTTLLKLIHDGDLKPNERLPSERELGEVIGVSRMTVRQAIQSLIHEGLLYTRVGKGTYVGEIRLEQDRALTGFSQEMGRRGLTPSSKVLEAAIVPAPPHIAEKLDIEPNSGVFRLSRLRLANDQVIASEIVHLPRALCPELLEHDFSKESLYAVLQNECGISLVTADQTVEAALANQHERRMLQLKSPAAVLRMKRITRTEQGTVAEYTESVYRGDRFKLTTSLQAASA